MHSVIILFDRFLIPCTTCVLYIRNILFYPCLELSWRSRIATGKNIRIMILDINTLYITKIFYFILCAESGRASPSHRAPPDLSVVVYRIAHTHLELFMYRITLIKIQYLCYYRSRKYVNKYLFNWMNCFEHYTKTRPHTCQA